MTSTAHEDQFAMDPTERIKRLEEALDRALSYMASHASQTGSMHGWWDVIGELREVRKK